MTKLHVPSRELKICGTTTIHDAVLLNGTAVNYCGVLVDVAFSPRTVSQVQARSIAGAFQGKVVILLCNPSVRLCAQVLASIQPFALQFLCEETPEFLRRIRDLTAVELWKSIHVPRLPSQAMPQAYVEAGADRVLFDARIVQDGVMRLGGTGHVADWTQVQARIRDLYPTPCFLAGGIHAGNVREAIVATRPAGIDLCSGVEATPGRRDPDRLAHLLQQWRVMQEIGQ